MTLPGTESEIADESDQSGVSAALLVGWIMVAVYLLSTVLAVYERVLLDSFYPDTQQFALVRSLFLSPTATDLLAWQDVVLFQAVPFLLFFYFAVRMGVSPLEKLRGTVVAILLVGACLFLLNLVLNEYEVNISSLLLTGSFADPNLSPPIQPIGAVLTMVLSPSVLWSLLANSVMFAALGVTGIAFGNFSGETPYWILKGRLASRDTEQQESSLPEEVEP